MAAEIKTNLGTEEKYQIGDFLMWNYFPKAILVTGNSSRKVKGT
jgi:hypothetical protein